CSQNGNKGFGPIFGKSGTHPCKIAKATDGTHEACSRPPAAPAGSPMFELALPFPQGVRLDQQTLSFIAAPCLAEAYHHRVPGAFRLDPAREQRVPGRQKFEIVETRASQTRGAGT